MDWAVADSADTPKVDSGLFVSAARLRIDVRDSVTLRLCLDDLMDNQDELGSAAAPPGLADSAENTVPLDWKLRIGELYGDYNHGPHSADLMLDLTDPEDIYASDSVC